MKLLSRRISSQKLYFEILLARGDIFHLTNLLNLSVCVTVFILFLSQRTWDNLIGTSFHLSLTECLPNSPLPCVLSSMLRIKNLSMQLIQFSCEL